MCEIKVLAPQSGRVQAEGDGERGKGEEEGSSLGKGRRRLDESMEASRRLFFLISSGSLPFHYGLSSITQFQHHTKAERSGEKKKKNENNNNGG